MRLSSAHFVWCAAALWGCSAGEGVPSEIRSGTATGQAGGGTSTGAATGTATGATTGTATGTATGAATGTATGATGGNAGAETTATGTAAPTGSTTGSMTSTGSAASGGSGAVSVTDPEIMFEGVPEQMAEGCNELQVGFEKRRPTVLILVDTSSSMFTREGTSVRAELWDPLYAAVLGVITDLQDEVDFGFTSYTSVSRGDAPQGVEDPAACPVLARVASAPNNLDAIGAAYEAAGVIPTTDHKWETPTGDAIAAVAPDLAALPSEAPKYILLVTDGDPDTCLDFDPQCGADHSVVAIQNAFTSGITTYTVGIGDILNSNSGCVGRCGEEHLQDLANAGVGQPVAPNPDLVNTNCLGRNRDENGTPQFEGTYATSEAEAGTAEYFAAADATQLSAALGSILQGVRSCDFAMGKDVDATKANLGEVQLIAGDATTVYGLDDPNGWIFVAPNIVRLQGTACESVQNLEGGTIDISFPCEAYIR